MRFMRLGSSARLSATFGIGLIGFVLSIVLHELFHVLMHWGHVTAIHIFP